MRRRLFWAMIAVALVTLLIGGVTASVLIARSVEADRRAEFFRQAAATSRLIQLELDAPADDATIARHVQRLERTLLVAKEIGGHEYVEAALVSDRRDVLLPADAALIPALPVDLGQVSRSGEQFQVDVAGREITALARSFAFIGDSAVLVVIGSDTTLVPWDLVVGRLLLALTVAVALAAVLAVLLSRSLGRRLDGLATAAEGIAGGDLAARAPEHGGDELAAVARSFNQMAAGLEDAQRRERDFLMSVSHDLRTPLTTIRGYAEGLADDAVPSADLPRVGSVLAAQADRLSRLIEDLMLLSRLEARQFTLRPEPVDLAAHVKEAAEAMRPRADAARVRLAVEVDEVGIVAVDPDRVSQIAGNLLENGLRYTPEGGVVSVKLQRSGQGAVTLRVADTGPGIDPTDIPRIFERLYVAQRYRPVRPEGSGLGLNIVKELVDAMGGSIAVDSAPGRGTAVTITLAAS